VWFTEASANKIARISPSGQVTEFPIPTLGAHPLDIVRGSDGNLWFTENGAARIGRITSGTCGSNPTTLCLNNGRFKVEVTWAVPSQGRNGVGKALPLTNEAGAFCFFDSSNLELMVKVVDGRAVNGHFWVFYGALSNVEYRLTVTDTQQPPAVKTYFNPQGQVASLADTAAFQ
jgi:hypothetical protein